MAMYQTSYMTCEMKVDTKSSGWHRTITKILERVREASYSIDTETGIATISGRIDPKKLLTLLEKAGKHAQILKVESGSNKPYEPEEEEENNYVGMVYEGVNSRPVNGCNAYPQYIYHPMVMPSQPIRYYEDGNNACSIM